MLLIIIKVTNGNPFVILAVPFNRIKLQLVNGNQNGNQFIVYSFKQTKP